MTQKTGALIFDETADRYDIRFDLNDYYGGLHCGDCFEVFVRGKWKPTRMTCIRSLWKPCKGNPTQSICWIVFWTDRRKNAGSL